MKEISNYYTEENNFLSNFFCSPKVYGLLPYDLLILILSNISFIMRTKLEIKRYFSFRCHVLTVISALI